MTSVVDPPDLEAAEKQALAGLAAEAAATRSAPDVAGEQAPDPADAAALRHTLAVLCPTVAAGIMIGGIFNGASPRVYAILAGIAGAALAYGVQRLRNPVVTTLAIAGGLFLVGLTVAALLGGGDVLTHFSSALSRSITRARQERPPISITPGFGALVGWIMAGVGVAAVWVATVLRRPAVGVILPLTVAGIAGISVPQGEQVVDGVLVLVLLGIGLGILSGDRDAGDRHMPLAYEVRRGLKALPLLAAVAIGLLLLGLNTTFLFPHPAIDPTLQAQRPRTAPLSAVSDRVLFEVESSIDGPWVVGALDVYDGQDWLLAPFAQSSLREVPSTGLVDTALRPGVIATFTIHDLGGANLPVPPNVVGIQASGPKLTYDGRSGDIRLVEGQVPSGFRYEVSAAAAPRVADVEPLNRVPAGMEGFTAMPPMPPAVRALIAQAPKSSKWQEFDFLRRDVLHTVTAAGPGTPVSIPPSRVEEILGRTRQASPYEIVATQVMLARWIGLPARIGYGFDVGTRVGPHRLQIHPKDGAAFPEVFFSGWGWVPVIGQPEHAQSTLNANPALQQTRNGVLPSKDVPVPLFLPAVVPPDTDVAGTVRTWTLAAIALLALVALLYVLQPLAVKTWLRARRRAQARAAGPRARVVQAYAEWRDTLTDYGYQHPSDTPIMLLQRFPDDDEHTELAWLVTRSLWGDLQAQLSDEVAQDAEELARTLGKRLAQAHPLTVRAVARLSRLSLRRPFAVEETWAAAPTPAEAPRAAA